MMEYWQIFTAVMVGGICGWLSGYYRGNKDAQDVALAWAARMDKRLGGALLREAEKVSAEIADELKRMKR